MRIAMITRWGVACGLDNYSRELVESVSGDVEIAVFADREPQAVDYGFRPLFRDWEMGSEAAVDLLADLEAFAPDVIHVQYNIGYLPEWLLESVLKYGQERRTPVIVQLHAVVGPDGPDQLHSPLESLLPLLQTASLVLVHSEKDATRLAEAGLSENVRLWRLGEYAWPRFEAGDMKRAIGLEDRFPVLATFGFLQPRKGTLDLIVATHLLKSEFPSALLVACNAIHPRAGSSDYHHYYDCLREVDRLGLASNVALITSYLPQGDAMVLLQASDLIVLPYRDTPEGTSAAAKFCAAAGRPMLVSGEQIFDSYRDSTALLADETPSGIAEAVRRLLASDEESGRLAEAAASLADSLSWERVSREYLTMLQQMVGEPRMRA